MQRIIVTLLLTIFILSIMSCGEEANVINDGDVEITTTAEEVVETTNDPAYTDDLGEMDFEDKEFRIYTFENDNFHYSLVSDGEDGDVLNDAIYQRNLTVQERFKVTITQILYPDGDGTPRNIILAGEDGYEIAVIRCDTALSWWIEDLLVSYNDIPYIDLTKRYWDQSINDSLSLDNNNYIAVGAVNLDIYDLTFELAFNKDMAENYSINGVYDIVRDGGWTYDLMKTYMMIVTNDINGNGEWDENDSYGYTAHPKMVAPGFWIGAGVTSISKDGNDIPYISMTEEKFINVFEKIFNVVWDSEAAYLIAGDGKDIPTECRTLFANGNSLFMDISFIYIESLRGIDIEFGIIPYPKYEESQKDYHARVCYYMPTVVPVTSTDLTMTGYILEALNCESMQTVIPAYYEVALKTKYSRDNDSSEMLDLIFAARVIDIGDSTLCGRIRDNFIHTMMRNNNRDIVSEVAKHESSLTTYLDSIFE